MCEQASEPTVMIWNDNMDKMLWHHNVFQALAVNEPSRRTPCDNEAVLACVIPLRPMEGDACEWVNIYIYIYTILICCTISTMHQSHIAQMHNFVIDTLLPTLMCFEIIQHININLLTVRDYMLLPGCLRHQAISSRMILTVLHISIPVFIASKIQQPECRGIQKKCKCMFA